MPALLEESGDRRLAGARPAAKGDGVAVDRDRVGVKREQPALVENDAERGAQQIETHIVVGRRRMRIDDDPRAGLHPVAADSLDVEHRAASVHGQASPDSRPFGMEFDAASDDRDVARRSFGRFDQVGKRKGALERETEDAVAVGKGRHGWAAPGCRRSLMPARSGTSMISPTPSRTVPSAT